jgi:hypothetical protein
MNARTKRSRLVTLKNAETSYFQNQVYYIDNELARMAFVKGNGETAFACRLVYDFICLESDMQHRT